MFTEESAQRIKYAKMFRDALETSPDENDSYTISVEGLESDDYKVVVRKKDSKSYFTFPETNKVSAWNVDGGEYFRAACVAERLGFICYVGDNLNERFDAMLDRFVKLLSCGIEQVHHSAYVVTERQYFIGNIYSCTMEVKKEDGTVDDLTLVTIEFDEHKKAVDLTKNINYTEDAAPFMDVVRTVCDAFGIGMDK